VQGSRKVKEILRNVKEVSNIYEIYQSVTRLAEAVPVYEVKYSGNMAWVVEGISKFINCGDSFG
jgi:hypothetical protein